MSSVAMKRSRALHPPGVRLAREAGIALIGMAFVVCALLANHSWFERHFLPTFFAPFEVYTVGVQVGRIVVAGLGAAPVRPLRPRFVQCSGGPTSPAPSPPLSPPTAPPACC